MDGYTQLYFLNKPKIADFIFKKDYTFRNLSSKQAEREDWDSALKERPTNKIRTKENPGLEISCPRIWLNEQFGQLLLFTS